MTHHLLSIFDHLSVKGFLSLFILSISSIILLSPFAEAKYTPPDNQPAPQDSGGYGGTSYENESTLTKFHIQT